MLQLNRVCRSLLMKLDGIGFLKNRAIKLILNGRKRFQHFKSAFGHFFVPQTSMKALTGSRKREVLCLHVYVQSICLIRLFIWWQDMGTGQGPLLVTWRHICRGTLMTCQCYHWQTDTNGRWILLDVTKPSTSSLLPRLTLWVAVRIDFDSDIYKNVGALESV